MDSSSSAPALALRLGTYASKGASAGFGARGDDQATVPDRCALARYGPNGAHWDEPPSKHPVRGTSSLAIWDPPPNLDLAGAGRRRSDLPIHPNMTAKTPALLCAAALLGAQAFAQNDECSTAMPIAPGVYAFDTTTATLSPEIWPCASGGGPDLWYSVTASGDSAFVVETCGGGFDTALEVFTGTCGNLTSVACNDDACSVQSRVAFGLAPGATAYFRVGGFANAVGTGTLTVTEAVIPPPAGSVATWLGAVNTGTPRCTRTRYYLDRSSTTSASLTETRP
jgi:hypothetical protein